MLTDTQLAETRRYAGYPYAGDVSMDGGRDLAYGWVSPIIWQTLFHRLATLRPEEEARVVIFLATLAGLETDVTSATDNLDTDQAAVWVHNKNEVNDRMNLYRLWRRELCAFIGVPPGPGLGSSGNTSLARG
jgi:hypothetical protein